MKSENQMTTAASATARAIGPGRSWDMPASPPERARISSARARARPESHSPALPAWRLPEQGDLPHVPTSPACWRVALRAVGRALDKTLLYCALYGETMYPTFVQSAEYVDRRDLFRDRQWLAPIDELDPLSGEPDRPAAATPANLSAWAKIQRWRDSRRAEAALAALPDHVLKDLGLSRCGTEFYVTYRDHGH